MPPLTGKLPVATFCGKRAKKYAPSGSHRARDEHGRGGLEALISRVLCRGSVALAAMVFIHLGAPSPMRSSSEPGSIERAVRECSTILPCSKMGFTWPPPLPRVPVCSYHTLSTSPRRGRPPNLAATLPEG